MGGRGRVKRRQVSTDDGWTVITHGFSNLTVGNGKKKGKGGRGNVQAGSMPAEIVHGLTAEKLLQDFQNRTEKWKTTACAQHLEDVLRKNEWAVTEAVCIGIGSFSRDWEHRHRAIWQLVLFMGVVCHLRKSSTEIQLHAQEPAFTSLDHEFLSLLSVNVCADNIATHFTTRSFAFSPFVDWYILLPLFLKDKNPVLYVGNEILDDYGAFARNEEKREKLEECNKLGKKWLEKRHGVRLREFEMHPHALNGMIVYWIEAEQIHTAGIGANGGAISGQAGADERDDAEELMYERATESSMIPKVAPEI
ncbi:uncharacterized protein M421DRAFT_417359 [Didymella exigua CBS 183.55]|uniref:SRR1-like domain-containing protein n=1 Tax=Didymella exigua CBS 183.55 TaxID=1150837 RepID=A0A6A5RZB8_9PLEO|nr:uncharacterized protein M421DRAFT_417359 [Didymella exigua CBS 183.55]KAF1931596.1 hypothetical protein M421DRAFT_417359 [Didymella exigua CBS 183.55]